MSTFAYILRNGDKGQEVARLQRTLGELSVDGSFGNLTEAAVREYQTTHCLGVDGAAGPETLGRLCIPVHAAIDVSAYQGDIDWEAVAASGVIAVWIKVTEGRTHVNKGWRSRFYGAKSAGLFVGAYHFSRPDTNSSKRDAEREATHFLEACKAVGLHNFDLAPANDFEKGLKHDDQYNVDWMNDWNNVVRPRFQMPVLMYTAKWAYQLYAQSASRDSILQLTRNPLWWARYKGDVEPTNSVSPWDEWSVWQYSGSASVPGVKGKCDVNWLSGDALTRLTRNTQEANA